MLEHSETHKRTLELFGALCSTLKDWKTFFRFFWVIFSHFTMMFAYFGVTRRDGKFGRRDHFSREIFFARKLTTLREFSIANPIDSEPSDGRYDFTVMTSHEITAGIGKGLISVRLIARKSCFLKTPSFHWLEILLSNKTPKRNSIFHFKSVKKKFINRHCIVFPS